MKRLIEAAIIPPELYVERNADRQLAAVVDNMGRPGYILVSRQMGKTNLVIHTKRQLETSVFRFVYIDLSNKPKTSRECFRLISDSIVQTFPDLAPSAAAAIAVERRTVELPPYREHERELLALLREYQGRLVIVLDEIDALVGTDFSDEVFAQIRSIYFSRITYEPLSRLTYVLSGVVEPSELIKDPKRSPFNIGEKIYLEDFDRREISALVDKAGLRFPSEVVDAIFFWSGGHPRVTWDIVSKLEDAQLGAQDITGDKVREVVHDLYLKNFDLAPIDHIRSLVIGDPEIRGAIRALHHKTRTPLADWIRRKLFLAGVVKHIGEAPGVEIKSHLFREALAESWLEEIETRRDVLPSRADEQYQTGNYERAIELYEEFIRTRNDLAPSVHFLAFRQIGDCYKQLGDYEKALASFQRCRYNVQLESSEYYKTRFQVGLCAFQLERFAEAVQIFEEVAAGYKRSLLRCRASINLGASLLRMDEAANGARAENLFKETVRELSEVDFEDINEFSDLKLLALHNIAVLRQDAGDLDGARAAYDEALTLNRLAYAPALFLALADIAATPVAAENEIRRACSTIVKNRLRFGGPEFEIVGQDNSLIPYSADLFVEIVRRAADSGMFSELRPLMDVAKELGYTKGSSRGAVILSICVERFRKYRETFLKLIELASQDEIEAGGTDNELKRQLLVWRIVCRKELGMTIGVDIVAFVSVLTTWEASWPIADPEFLAFVYCFVELRNGREFLRGKDLIRVFRRAVELGETKSPQNRFIISFLDAQVSDQLGDKGGALRAAQKCIEEMEAIKDQEITVLGATTAEQIRVSAVNIASRSRTVVPVRNRSKKVGRNEPCPCGSGKKYKFCHGR